MRVLIANDAPLRGSSTGAYVRDLACAIQDKGHVVQCLIVDSASRSEEPFPVHRVVCRRGNGQADMPFDYPTLEQHHGSGQSYEALSDGQLVIYRDALRRALDSQMERFNPHVIHAMHLWVLGHLALEAGVPYLITTFGAELPSYRFDPRYRRFAQEAAENAARIVASDESVRQQVVAVFGDLDGRIVTGGEPQRADWAGWTLQLYRQALCDRFGAAPDG